MTPIEAIEKLASALQDSQDGQYGELINMNSTLHSIDGYLRTAVDLLEQIRDSLVQEP